MAGTTEKPAQPWRIPPQDCTGQGNRLLCGKQRATGLAAGQLLAVGPGHHAPNGMWYQQVCQQDTQHLSQLVTIQEQQGGEHQDIGNQYGEAGIGKDQHAGFVSQL